MQPQNSHHPPREWELWKVSEQGREAVSSNFSEDAADCWWEWSGCQGVCAVRLCWSASFVPVLSLLLSPAALCDSRIILCGLCPLWLQIATVSFQEHHRLLQKPLSLVNEELEASSVSPHTVPKCPGWAASRIAGLVLLDARNLAGCSELSQEI